MKAYLTNEQLQEARESIRNDMANGKTIKEQLKESTRLSSGIIFKARSLQLGKTVFDVHIDGRVGGQSFLYTWLHCECCGQNLIIN